MAAALLAGATGAARADEVVLHAVGDVMLAGPWTAELQRQGYDHSFAQVAAELARGDLTLANLESPIARSGTEYTDKRFRFRAEPELAPALRQAGINVVTLANNHSMDFGAAALKETRQHLRAAGVRTVGAGEHLAQARQPLVLQVRRQSLAFLAYSAVEPTAFYATSTRAGTAPAREALMHEDLAAVRPLADHVIVSLHWGTEGLSEVQPHQPALARRLIDAGADIVIGHHPHVLRGVERYRHGLIFYSLGNFAFASRSALAQHGAIVRLRLDGERREAEILPLDVHTPRVGFQPRLLTGAAGQAVVDRLNQLSEPFGTRFASAGGRHALNFSAPAVRLARAAPTSP